MVDSDSLLPWEKPDGDPNLVGICLSGGGLRSASFSLGALQALQERRGMLRGPKAANYIAAVSGGAYIVSSAFLNMASDPPDVFPLAPESPETSHILRNGRYLTSPLWQLPVIVIPSVFVSLLAAAFLFIWIGTFVTLFAVLSAEQLPRIVDVGIPTLEDPVSYLAIPALFGGVVALGATLQSDRASRVWPLFILGSVLIISSAPTFLDLLTRTDWLSSPQWWSQHPIVLLTIAVLYAVVSVLPFASSRLIRNTSNAVAKNVSRLFFVVAVSWVVAALEPKVTAALAEELSEEESFVLSVAFFAVLIGGLWAGYVHDVVSLHRPYRNLMSRCFAIRRNTAGGVNAVSPPTEARISTLVPPQDEQHRHPRILVCATANVRGRRDNAASFVFSHDRSGIAGEPDASFDTRKLELGKSRTSILGKGSEREVSLMGAVAMTGAAYSPSMGSKTSSGARPIMALLNARLGVWLPNPLSTVRREVVDLRPGRPSRWTYRASEHGRLGPGASQIVGEVLGSHSPNAKRIYVTDGGHYDNLGLLALLRARCAEIWCADAYMNAKHLGRQLTTVAKLAWEELRIEIDIDVERFALEEGSNHTAKNATAIGTITYPDTSVKARLIVMKLALTASSPLVDYRSRDRKFPYHSTFIQWYGQERFDSYRKLGHHIATEAMDLADSDS